MSTSEPLGTGTMVDGIAVTADADPVDVAEQARPLRDDGPVDAPVTDGWEADDADAVEQSRDVGFPDDEDDRA